MACGLGAGAVAGYLGVGGGIIVVPFLTLVLGVDVKQAIPVSVTAIVVSSLASSSEYLKKGMVELELAVRLALLTMIGNIVGSLLIDIVPAGALRITLAAVMVYVAMTMLASRDRADDHGRTISQSTPRLFLAGSLSLLIGVISALVGIGGGAILIPVMYLILRLPLASARGTSSLLIGFSASAACLVYLLTDRIDFAICAPVILGIVIGSRLGGLLGTRAKPLAVKIVFVTLLLYMAFRMSYVSIMEWR